jgi:hypothetical protein
MADNEGLRILKGLSLLATLEKKAETGSEAAQRLQHPGPILEEARGQGRVGPPGAGPAGAPPPGFSVDPFSGNLVRIPPGAEGHVSDAGMGPANPARLSPQFVNEQYGKNPAGIYEQQNARPSGIQERLQAAKAPRDLTNVQGQYGRTNSGLNSYQPNPAPGLSDRLGPPGGGRLSPEALSKARAEAAAVQPGPQTLTPAEQAYSRSLKPPQGYKTSPGNVPPAGAVPSLAEGGVDTVAQAGQAGYPGRAMQRGLDRRLNALDREGLVNTGPEAMAPQQRMTPAQLASGRASSERAVPTATPAENSAGLSEPGPVNIERKVNVDPRPQSQKAIDQNQFNQFRAKNLDPTDASTRALEQQQ